MGWNVYNADGSLKTNSDTVIDHAATHIRSGSDEVDGDQLDIDWNPSYYSPATTPTEVSSVDHLTAHLYGIDQVLDDLRNPPLYSAYRGGAFNANTTWSTIIWDNEAGDVKFGETPGGTITIPTGYGGEYAITAQLLVANGTTGDFHAIRVMIAGSEVARASVGGHNGNTVQVSTFNSISAGQGVQIERIANATRAATVGAQYCWVRIYKVGA